MQKNNKLGVVKLDKNMTELDKQLFVSQENRLPIEILNSAQKSDLYHFKVMELKSHEDTKERSECSIRFHFFFELIRPRDPRKNEARTKEAFDWDIKKKPVQRLYLSQDTTKLMEVLNNFVATIYTRSNVDRIGRSVTSMRLASSDPEHIEDLLKERQGQLVKWKVAHRVSRFPSSL